MSQNPYTPFGKTILVPCDVTAPSPVQCPASGTVDTVTYRIANPEANETIFYTIERNATEALNNAVAPGVGAPTKAIPLPAGGVEVLRGPTGAWFSGITRVAAANLYVQAGDGI